MAGRGYIRVERDAISHPFFRRSEFSEFEAWLWLLAEAAWKTRRRRAGEYFVTLDRGEVVAAVRYLAAAWSWSKGKVERFLFRLKNEGMIGTRTETGITIITICNYDKYQGGPEDAGTAMDQEPGQVRDSAGTVPGHGRDGGGDNSKAIKQSIIETGEAGEASITGLTLFGAEDPGPVEQPLAKHFDEFYAAYPKKVDPNDARRVYERVVKQKQATVEELLAGAQRYAVERAGQEKKYTKAPAVWLNKGSWKNESVSTASRNGIETGIDASFDVIRRFVGDDNQ